MLAPGIVARISVLESTVICASVVHDVTGPSNSTVALVAKFVPVSVILAVVPALTLVGAILSKVGSGLFVENVSADDVPPPGVGVTTSAV